MDVCRFVIHYIDLSEVCCGEFRFVMVLRNKRDVYF